MRLPALLCACCVLSLLATGPAASAPNATATSGRAAWPEGVVVVGYRSSAALQTLLARHPARVVRRLPALRVAELRPSGSLARYTAALHGERGVRYVERAVLRERRIDPAVARPAGNGVFEWQWAATHMDGIPPAALAAAAAITIAVVDTGADLSAPDLAAKAPASYSIVRDSADVTDRNGHGTFVAALAAGSPSNDDGVAGFGGEARLLVVQASEPDGSFTDVDEAAAIVYAVDRGARVINLSLGGGATSHTERSAIDYAASHGTLLVAAAGNEGAGGSGPEYPAALLQPIGSNGVGGNGLSVAASGPDGRRAPFSSIGSYVSLAAPGVDVFSAVSSQSAAAAYPRQPLPGSRGGVYGYGSGTSFAAPQVAGAAAVVWAAQPALTAAQVAQILKETASGRGAWTPDLGYGVIDVAAAVARATGVEPGPVVELSGKRAGRRVELAWNGRGAQAYRVSVARDSGPQTVLVGATTSTTATYAVAAGHAYAFTVAAVGDDGGTSATSRPYQVVVPRAVPTVIVSATRTSPRRQLHVVVVAQVRDAVEAVGAHGLPVVLETWDGTRWRPRRTSVTGETGRASWSLTLGRGEFRIRARVGDAVSAPLVLKL